jgi:hypothetical protein
MRGCACGAREPAGRCGDTLLPASDPDEGLEAILGRGQKGVVRISVRGWGAFWVLPAV